VAHRPNDNDLFNALLVEHPLQPGFTERVRIVLQNKDRRENK
jgi:hypothetical protein